MARSLGNSVFQTKAWRRVETKRRDTMVEDMKERASASPLLTTVGTCSAYFMVATEAVVIENVDGVIQGSLLGLMDSGCSHGGKLQKVHSLDSIWICLFYIICI
ncbi:hypothetical protein SDJN02_09531 [Cucurbita argyrosperma subsp. argyrosperma]|nr:hypothetical protein SDJN02_09531 [Cucurbita argyrosperma subsp. argyrosperma]